MSTTSSHFGGPAWDHRRAIMAIEERRIREAKAKIASERAAWYAEWYAELDAEQRDYVNDQIQRGNLS
jgi:hypothetical protein